jgi:NADPH:quinone reductase-like Zn-dependent oxidoreductase
LPSAPVSRSSSTERRGHWGLLVALAGLRGAQVIATAGPTSRQRVAAPGAADVIDYHDPDWPGQVRALTAAANAAPGGAATAIRAIADRGRLATITSDPPSRERGITVANVYLRPDGTLLRQVATHLRAGRLHIPVAASYHPADAAQALARATGGHPAGAIALTP